MTYFRSLVALTAALACSCLASFTSAEQQASLKTNNISLPSGPGSLEGLGKAFEPSLNTGGASYSVDIAVPAGTSGHAPKLSLNYSSGKGQGQLGLGWDVSVPYVERSLENGQPLYSDADVLTYMGETMVPLTDGTYAPAMQTQFIRFTQVGLGWVAKDKAGNTFEFGQTQTSVETGLPAYDASLQLSTGPDTREVDGTYRWYLHRMTDAKGQSTEYTYQQLTSNKTDEAQSVNVLYPKTVAYGPSVVGLGSTPDEIADLNYKNTIEFIYEARPDAFTSYQAGFQQTTAHRLKQVSVQHGLRALWHYDLSYEAKGSDLLYPEKEQNALNSGLGLLRKVTRWNGDRTVSLPPMRFEYSLVYANDMDLPPLNNFPADEDIDRNGNGVLDNSALITVAGLPTGLNVIGAEATFVDLTSDGLPDWLFWKNGEYQWAKNLGPNESGQPEFSAAKDLNRAPAAPLNESTVHLVDLDGDGQSDFLFRGSDNYWQFYRNQGNGDFAAPVKYPATASLRPGDDGTQFMDMNLDQRLDIVSAQNQYWRYCLNGSEGVANGNTEHDGYDQDLAPFGNFPGPEDIDFNGNKQLDIPGWQCTGSIPSPLPAGINLTNKAVKMVDMNGDRLKDVVWVRELNGKIQIQYWPHKGKLQFAGAKSYLNSPDATGIVLDRLRVQDINGDGMADLVYIQPGQVRFWLQQFGNGSALGQLSWSEEQALTAPNYVERATAVFDADLNGNGTSDIIWVSASGETNPQYLDISGDTKAHLLNVIDNGMGLRTQLSYTSMGAMQAEAANAKQSWNVSSPVAQQVVSKRTHILPLDTTGDEKHDRIEQTYTYRDAYYDPYKKQFRGFSFARVETLGDSKKGTQISRHFFHTGAPDGQDNDGDGDIDERELDGTTEELSLKGKTLSVELTSKDVELADNESATSDQLVQFTNSQWYIKRIHSIDSNVASTSGKEVSFAFPQKENTFYSEFNAEPKQSSKEHFYDAWGNLEKTIDYGLLDDVDDDKTMVNEYAFHSNGIYQLPSSSTTYAGQNETGEKLQATETLYDHLPKGQLTRGLATKQKAWKEDNTWVTQQTSEYDNYGNPILLIDGDGRRRQLVWDQQWHAFPTEEWIYADGIDKTPLRVQAIYDTGLGVLKHHIGFNEEVTSLKYDAFGRLLTIQKPNESEASTLYSYHFVDPFRKLEYQFTAAEQKQTSNAVDSTSYVQTHLLREDGQIEEVRAHIDGLGRELATITKDDLGYIVAESKWYDYQGRAIKTFRPWRTASQAFILPVDDQIATDIELDAHGRPLSETYPEDQLGHRSIVSYEYLPRKVRITDPASYQTEQTLNAEDKVLTLRQQHHVNTQQPNVLEWKESQFKYDALGRMVRITDAHNNIKEQRFNGLGHKVWQSDLDQGITLYEYDNSGNLTLKTDQLGRKLYYQYDYAGRLKNILNNNYGLLYAYHYDKPQYNTGLSGYKGKLTWVEEFEVGCVRSAGDVTHQCANGNLDKTNAEHYHYDLRGNVIHKTRSLKGVPYKFHFQYDLQDRLTRQVWPDGDSIDYQYNLRGQTKRIFSPNGNIIDGVNYHEDGQIESISYANGTTQTRDYDDKGQLVDLISSGAGTSAGSQIKLLTYNYDLRGNLTRIDDLKQSKHSQVFEYDALSQLKKATGAYGQLRYGYDAIGNMTSKHHDANGGVSSGHNLGVMSYGGSFAKGGGTKNRLAKGGQPGPHAITNSADGREWNYNGIGQRESALNKDGTTSHYQWDQLGRMTQWQLKSSTEELLAQESYLYDFKGRRLHKFASSVGANQSAKNVSYIDKSYEIRDDSTQKHLFLGNLRVARLETPISQALQQIKNFSLNPGWNQIFMPIQPEGTSILDQMGSGDLLVSHLLKFDADKQQHQAFAPKENALVYKTLNKISARDVLWVKADSQHTWQVRGKNTDAEKVSQPLKAGWNHVSLPLEKTITADAFTHGTAIEKIWAYDAANNKWTYWKKNPIDHLVGAGLPAINEPVGAQPVGDPTVRASLLANNSLSELNPNQIYWVYTKRDQVIAQANGINSTRYFLHNNHLGSVAVETAANGAIHQSSLYQPYGANGKADANTNRVSTYSFSAKEQDGSGLYYFEARYYDPLTTRFISPDPLFATEIEKCVDSIIECNLYQYTGNNPVNFVDLLGLEVSYFDRVLASGNGVATGVFTSIISPFAYVGGEEVHAGLFTDFGDALYRDPTLARDFQAGHNTGYVIGFVGLFTSAKASSKPLSTPAVSLEANYAKITSIRSELNIGLKRNIAFATYTINGAKGEMIAVSGGAQRPGTVSAPVSRKFTTITTGKNDRKLDSEAKILENIAAGLSSDAKGVINLHSERTLCVSCSGIVNQFKDAFPNIKLNVTSGSN